MYEAIDPRPLSRVVILWLYIWLAVQPFWIINCVWTAVRLSALPGSTPLNGSEDLTGNPYVDIALGGLGLAIVISFCGSGYLILRWIYRTNKNAHAFSPDMTVSPGWAVGWFFIPIAFLWMPFEGVRQTWQVSHGGENWSGVETPSALRWWWGLWLVTNILSNISLRLSLEADTAGMLVATNMLDILSSLLEIPLCLILIWIVRRLTEAQVRMIQGSVFA